MAGFEQIAAAVPRGPRPPFKTAKLPDDCGSDTVSMGGITSLMQRDAARVAAAQGGDDFTATEELVKRAVAKLNGQPFMFGNPEFDPWWEKIGSRGRTCLIQLYYRRNALSREESDAFLASAVDEN